MDSNKKEERTNNRSSAVLRIPFAAKLSAKKCSVLLSSLPETNIMHLKSIVWGRHLLPSLSAEILLRTLSINYFLVFSQNYVSRTSCTSKEPPICRPIDLMITVLLLWFDILFVFLLRLPFNFIFQIFYFFFVFVFLSGHIKLYE